MSNSFFMLFQDQNHILPDAGWSNIIQSKLNDTGQFVRQLKQ